MAKVYFLVLLLGLGGSARAQGSAASGPAREALAGPATGQAQAVTFGDQAAAEAALRAKARPMLDFMKAQSSALSELRKAHAAARKQQRAASDGGADAKERKALGKLIKAQRAEMRRAASAARAERARFVKANPEAESALRELQRRGLAVEERPAEQVP